MNAGIGPAQIEQGVQLDGPFGGAKGGPGEEAQAQIDGGGVQRIDGRVEVQHRRRIGIRHASAGDQPLRQRVVDAPVARMQRMQRIGQRRPRRRRLQSHVEQLGLIGGQAHFDVAQRLAPREPGEGQDAKHIGAAERAHPRIALVPRDNASEGLPRHELHDLREQRFAHVHASLRVVHSPEHCHQGRPISNRGHPCNRGTRHHH